MTRDEELVLGSGTCYSQDHFSSCRSMGGEFLLERRHNFSGSASSFAELTDTWVDSRLIALSRLFLLSTSTQW